MERSVLPGLAVFRWGAWLWVGTVVVVSRRSLERPWLGVGLVVVAFLVTAFDTLLLRRDRAALLRPGRVVVELAVGFALVLCDGWAYGPGHVFSTSQSLGSLWPLAGVLTAGVALGPTVASAAGGLVGVARIGSALANGATVNTAGRVVSLASSIVFYALAGGAAGYVTGLLRRSEREISAARAREEVARTLHDGVLQTLALVERRATDPDLARLARRQELELREYLGRGEERGGRANGRVDLAIGLRDAARRFEETFGGRVDVVVAADVARLDGRRGEALVGAAAEALTNAGKHGAATMVTVYAEPTDDGGVFCSVKDNGSGFDPEATQERLGLGRSVRGRIAEAGGRVEVRSTPGKGSEVCLWLP